MATGTRKPDRYKTFLDIDCEGNAVRLIALLRRHIDDPEKTNPYWEKFKEKLARADQVGERSGDMLLLIHASINNIRELFEEFDDREALRLLDRLEEECC